MRTAVTATAAYGGVGPTGDLLSICRLAADGGCRTNAVQLGGFSLRAGVERFVGPLVAFYSSFGAGWYADRDGNGAQAFPLTVGVVVPMIFHVAVVASAQRTEFRHYHGENFVSSALLLGLRAQ